MSNLSKEEMQLVVKAVDEASRTFAEIKKAVEGVGAGAKETADKVEGLGGRLGSLQYWIKAGFGLSIGHELFSVIKDGIKAIADAIPDAIRAGNEWVRLVDDVQDVTGLAAGKASLLLAVMRGLDIPVGNSARVMTMFGQRLKENVGLLNELGVATVDANGKQLDAFTILDNLRHRFSEYGAGLTQTAAAQKLLGRTGFEMLDFLQLTDEQFRALAQSATDAGLVIDDLTARRAKAFRIELGQLGNTITGLQTSIFAGLAPSLTSFVAAFTGFLKQNLQQIVMFAVNAANFVMGVIGGLLGVDFEGFKISDDLTKNAEAAAGLDEKLGGLGKSLSGAKSGEDALTKSLRAQIDAIDAQIRKIDEREAKRHQASERAKLQAAIEGAQSQLTDLVGNAPYLAGMSAGEAVLAQQKYNQDVLDARKKLADAVAALASFEADASDDSAKAALEKKKETLQDQLQAHQKTTAGMAADIKGLQGVSTRAYDGMADQARLNFAKINAAGQAWRDNGVKFAGDIKKAVAGLMDTLLGEEVWHQTSAAGSGYVTRSGGLMGAFKAIGDVIKFVSDVVVGTFNGLKLIVKKVVDWIGDIFAWIGKWIDKITGAFQAPPSDPSGGGGYGGGYQMGGHMDPGGIYRVGEVAAETIYMDPHGKGATVYGRQTASGGASSGGGHGHDIYLDGYLVGRTMDARNWRTGRNASTSIRPAGASA